MSNTPLSEGGVRAIAAFLAERNRGQQVEGYTAEHDDKHADGELAQAAACYALPEFLRRFPVTGGTYRSQIWPWEAKWWKPAPAVRKREIEKAGALLLAEWERLDRLETLAAKGVAP